jgi:hypothetical protein
MSQSAHLAQIPFQRDPDTPRGEQPSAKVAAQRPFIYRQVKLGFDEVTIVEAATGTTAGDLALALSLLEPSSPVRFFDTDGETLFIEF